MDKIMGRCNDCKFARGIGLNDCICLHEKMPTSHKAIARRGCSGKNILDISTVGCVKHESSGVQIVGLVRSPF